MRIVNGSVPPLFDEIAAAFPLATKPGVMFCWGDLLFVPKPVGPIPPELIAHELVHCERQMGQDLAAWWRRYMADPEFRLAEELPAHVAEYRSMCKQPQPRGRWVSARNMRRTFAAHVARKLSAPLYGPMISFEAAKKAIATAAD